ncbi:hypothetical protein FQR65_LT11849 [Abscondita terminalis]|nr:hypothetical protein FQR65_LT11849 [Abscondita terminalis]
MNVSELKYKLRGLGAKTTGPKNVLEKRLNTWTRYNLNKTLFNATVAPTIETTEEFPPEILFKPLRVCSGIKLITFKCIQTWFLERHAKKGMQKGRILAMKLFIKYTKINKNGNTFYLKGKCCAEQKKTLEYNVRMMITKTVGNEYCIKQCNCTCPAGTGWSAACKHIGAFCFSLEYFSETGKLQEYVSCTSEAMLWNKPTGRGVDIMSIFEITGQQKQNVAINENCTFVNQLINNNICCPFTNSRKANMDAYENDHCYMKVVGKCCAEQKKTLEYNVRMMITKTVGNEYCIKQCNCTCPAGTGWSAACKHIGAFCFSLEYFSETGKLQEYVSCTSEAMLWNKPTGRGVDIMSIFEITGQQKQNVAINENCTFVNQLINNNICCPFTNSRKANMDAYENDHCYMKVVADELLLLSVEDVEEIFGLKLNTVCQQQEPDNESDISLGASTSSTSSASAQWSKQNIRLLITQIAGGLATTLLFSCYELDTTSLSHSPCCNFVTTMP